LYHCFVTCASTQRFLEHADETLGKSNELRLPESWRLVTDPSALHKSSRSAANRPFAGHLVSPLFAGLAQSELDTLLSAASHQAFPAKTVVTEEGDPASHFFLLVSGRARYFFLTPQGKKVILRCLAPGEGLGGLALVSEPMCYAVSSEAVTQISTLVWERATLRRFLVQYPKLLDNALSVMAKYLVLYRIEHAALICENARQRLATAVSDLARCSGHPTARGVELNVTNEELANAANITSFTASRLLNDWQRKNLISKKRGRILVFSPDKLISQAA
jgi:CRP/FNR family transcriptional regulator, nitrogen oxide reductase regulator